MKPTKPIVVHGGAPAPARSGKIGTGILLWLLGIPIPVILLIFLIKGCVT